MNNFIPKQLKRLLILASISVILTNCTAPKSITDSGKVTPKNQLKIGVSYNANIPTQTIKNAVEVVNTGVKAAKIMDENYDKGGNTESGIYTIGNSPEFKNKEGDLSRYVLGYSVDPMTYGINYYARYGIAKRFDIGYQYSGGTSSFDGKYQFLGSTGEIGSYNENRLYGSIGLQYSSRKYELPMKLGVMQNYFDYKFKRKDFFVPIVFSKSFGNEEKIGHFSWGVAYNLTYLEYGFQNKIYESPDAPYLLTNVDVKKFFSSYGTFINVKTGYKYVYFLVSLAAYYTDYGTYKLIDDSQARLTGFTFVPSIGIQGMIPPMRKKKK